MVSGPFRHILITGASSPIAGSLASQFRRDTPGARIVALSRQAPTGPCDEWVAADLASTLPAIDQTFDLVIHTAAAVPARVAAPEEFRAVNVDGSAALFRSLSLTPDCAVLNFSSSAVYDAPGLSELDERASLTSDGYGATKHLFEEILRREVWRPGRTVLSLRIPVLLVPGVRHNFVAKWVASILTGAPITLFNPDGLLNAVADDLAIYQFARRFLSARPGMELTCNIAARMPIPIRDASRIVMATLGRTVDVLERPAPKPTQTISTALAQRHGYEPPSTADCLSRFAARVRDAEAAAAPRSAGEAR